MIGNINIKKFCSGDFSLIENYNKAIKDNNLYDCHHRLETHDSNGNKRLVNLSVKELKALGMYYNRPPEEFIFLTHENHTSLHLLNNKINLNKKFNIETRKKMGLSHKGKKKNEETKAKMSLGQKKYKHSIRCLELNLIFDSVKEASEYFDVNRSNIRQSANKGYRCKGFHLEYFKHEV